MHELISFSACLVICQINLGPGILPRYMSDDKSNKMKLSEIIKELKRIYCKSLSLGLSR